MQNGKSERSNESGDRQDNGRIFHGKHRPNPAIPGEAGPTTGGRGTEPFGGNYACSAGNHAGNWNSRITISADDFRRGTLILDLWDRSEKRAVLSIFAVAVAFWGVALVGLDWPRLIGASAIIGLCYWLANRLDIRREKRRWARGRLISHFDPAVLDRLRLEWVRDEQATAEKIRKLANGLNSDANFLPDEISNFYRTVADMLVFIADGGGNDFDFLKRTPFELAELEETKRKIKSDETPQRKR